jgi:hypothetical protein
MKTIYKYELDEIETQEVLMPFDADILSVHNQRNKVCVWALVESDNTTKQKRSFSIYPTGHEIKTSNHFYIGTVLLHEGVLVLHVFENIL